MILKNSIFPTGVSNIQYSIFNIIIICLSIYSASAQTQFPWPVTPFNQSQDITGNFAEYRSTSANGHFHNGTDIPKPDGSPVYPVKNGTIVSLSPDGSSAFVRVDDLAYVHIAPNPSLSVGDPVIAQQTVLGTILPGLGHVHFTNGFIGSEKNSMLENSGLTPYNDPWPPIIRFIRFYQNNTTSQFSTNELSGLVDIVAKVDEQHGSPSSNLSRRNNGTYKIGYKIFNADTSTIIVEPPNNGLRFQLDTKPNNSFVNIVYFRPLSSTTSHAYTVTNNVGNDNFWNTAALPEDDYIVMVFTEDTRGNTDTAYVAVRTTEADFTAPAQPTLKSIKETDSGMRVAWFSNTEDDLLGYRLFFSFDNETWSLFRDETVFTSAVTDTTLNQIINRDVYFRLIAVDDAPLPNESIRSDTYGMSNGGDFIKKVLIVDGFDRTNGGWSEPFHHFGFTHGSAIIANQFSFDTVPNEAIEDSLTDLNDYEAVIWILGDESGPYETFSAQEQALVKNYLESGGFLFVRGSEIATDLDQDGSGTASPEDEDFLNNYLKATFVAHDAESVTASGSANAIFDGLDFGFGQIPYPVATPDVVEPVGENAVAALQFDATQIAGVQYEGTFGQGTAIGKVVYLAFPFETIAEAEVRTQVMGRVLNFFFNITAIDGDSNDDVNIPAEFSLSQNYPNPFNPATTIQYAVPKIVHVTLKIYDTLGREVATLVDKRQPAGRHQIEWDAADLASGIYIYRITAGSFTQARKLILAR